MEDLNRIKQLLLSVTKELVANCQFCVEINSDPDDKTPIQCVKYSGNSTPISLNAATCLSCKEYKKTDSFLQMKGESK
jgi:hypothetical protein